MNDTSNMSQKEILHSLPSTEILDFLENITDEELLALEYDLGFVGRPKQQIPPGDWANWLVLAGRGFGKTFVGAHFINTYARNNPGAVMCIMGETAKDIREYNILGKSGIVQQSHPNFIPKYIQSKSVLEYPNGSRGLIYSAQEPEALRGAEFHCAWLDELAKYQYQDEVWDQLGYCLRLGKNPQTVITTTPRPTKLIKEIVADSYTYLTHGTMMENAANLPPKFIQSRLEKYEGTRLGRQEIYAEILDDNPNALFDLDNFAEFRIPKKKMKNLIKIVVAVDPAITANEHSDETGIIVAGMDNHGHGYVLEDLSLIGTPSEWAAIAVKAYHKWQANCIVAEVNQGGDMVKTIMHNEDKNIAYDGVRATKGKAIRAEPVAALYEQGRIHHVGMFAEMEDQMANFDPTMKVKDSPDRMDALVWAFTKLFDFDLVEPKIWFI